MSTGGGESLSALPAEVASAALRDACDVVGVSAQGAQLQRLGMEAVFRLAGGRGVVRIVRGPDAGTAATRAVRVARWLDEVEFSAARLLPVPQPVMIGDCAVTFWRPVADQERRAGLSELGDLIRRAHWLVEPASLGLMRLVPLSGTREAIGAAPGLSQDDRSLLLARSEILAKRFDELDFVLPTGLIYGGSSLEPAVLDAAGRAVLVDLDSFAVGPREWDLVLPAVSFERYGWRTRSEYGRFVHAYGFDVMNWYGYPVLADVRELLMTVRLACTATVDETAAVEVARRLADLRTGADRHGWRPL
jgi:hypothetical protein